MNITFSNYLEPTVYIFNLKKLVSDIRNFDVNDFHIEKRKVFNED